MALYDWFVGFFASPRRKSLWLMVNTRWWLHDVALRPEVSWARAYKNRKVKLYVTNHTADFTALQACLMQTPGLLYTDLQTHHIHTTHKSVRGKDDEILLNV